MATESRDLGLVYFFYVGRGMVHHFLRMKVCQLVDLQEHTSSFLINIRALLIFFFLPVYILQGWPDS